MDVDLFLEMQGKWAEDSPHCLVILHEMFCHATSEKGGKRQSKLSTKAISSTCPS